MAVDDGGEGTSDVTVRLDAAIGQELDISMPVIGEVLECCTCY